MFGRYSTFAGIICIVCSLLFQSGCTNMREVSVDAESIALGDTIRVVTSEGSRFTFAVTALDDGGVAGSPCKDCPIQRFEFNELDVLQLRHISVMKTTGLAVGLIVAGAVASDSGSGFVGQPSGPSN